MPSESVAAFTDAGAPVVKGLASHVKSETVVCRDVTDCAVGVLVTPASVDGAGLRSLSDRFHALRSSGMLRPAAKSIEPAWLPETVVLPVSCSDTGTSGRGGEVSRIPTFVS